MDAELIIDFFGKNAIGKTSTQAFYLINYENFSQNNFLLNHDKIEIEPLDFDIEDLQDEIKKQYKLLQKKYNFLFFQGIASIKNLISKNENISVYGIIDFRNKTQYGKCPKNKFLSLFKPLSNAYPKMIIATNKKYTNNVYALSGNQIEYYEPAKIYKINCHEILGDINNEQNDYLSCFPNLTPQKIFFNNQNIKKTQENFLDLTHENIFSIDGDTTTDIDDAIHYSETNGHTIGIHIANVAHFILNNVPQLELKEMLEKICENAVSIYLPHKRLDMISKNISENDCSLTENIEKKSVSLIINFSEKDGKYFMQSANVSLSLIKNKHKLTYKEVDKILRGGKTKDKKLKDDLFMIKCILENCEENVFDNTETEYQSDEIISRNLVQKLMTFYNTILAGILYKNNRNSIMRVHYGIKNDEVPNNKITKVLERLNNLKGYYARSGKIEEDELKHNALGLKYYCHASSPIRRFVDLWNQICLYEVIYYKNIGLITDRFEKLDGLNMKLYQIKKGYYDLINARLYHDKLQNRMENNIFSAHILDFEGNKVLLYIPELEDKICRFNLINERLSDILEIENLEDGICLNKDGQNFILKKYEKITVEFYINKNGRNWNNKIILKITEPNLEDFLLN